MTARRSRTGCATCRKRKLKCDEARPVCGQCTKSRRECVPSEGVAFRHEQNAGMNSDIKDGERKLEAFFKGRELYTPEQKRNFVPIPFPLEWRQVTDVYAEDNDQAPSRLPSSPQAYQREVASHSLEALSTAATENQPYQPPVTYADFNNLYQNANGGYGPANGAVPGPNQNHNIKFLLNPSSTSAAMIDPNLDAAAIEAMEEVTQDSLEGGVQLKHDLNDKNEDIQHNVTNEEQVAFLLKNFDEQPA